jgi:type VI secretion system protein ImpB
MAKESNQHKLDRVRKPRVHLTYDVTIGGAIQEKELPFVVGVMADLSGKPEVPLPKLDKRSFVEIDRVNFDKVLAGMKPRLAFQVDNLIENNNTKFGVELRFNRMEDFEPEQIAQQVEPLRQLLERRQRLQNLRDKLDSQRNLEPLLQQVIGNTDTMKKLSDEIGRGTPGKES